jgi:hypothetical protein
LGHGFLHFSVIASEAKQSSRVNTKGLDCFVASAQNCYAILSRAPRNDELVARSNHKLTVIARLDRAIQYSRDDCD